MKKLNKIITGAVCAAAASAGLTISARAVDTTLTLSQTLALYGTSLDVLYSSTTTGTQTPFTLSFIGTSLDFVPDLSPNNTNLIIDASYGYAGDIGSGDVALLNYAPYLRYGGYINTLELSPAVGHIQGTYSVDLSPITSFSSCFLVSKGTGRNWGTDSQEYNATASQNQSKIYFNTSYNASILRNSSTNSAGRQRVILTPYVKRSIGADKDLSDDFVMSMWLDYANSSIENDGASFSLDGWSIDWVRPAGRSLPDSVPDNGRGYVEIWIQCPTIGDYSPPVTTTAPQTTTRPQTYTTRSHDYTQFATTPQNTVDLSQIEENQRIQIEIENDNRNYNAGTFDGINIIIEQLNDIYAQMQARGEIAVDLLDGAHPDFLSSDMRADVRSALSSHTTARLPDVQSGKTFFGALFDWITQFRYVAAFAFFSLAVGFAAYVIFRG